MDELAISPRTIPPLPLAGRLLSDERLARLVSRGSAQAFAVLYTRHHVALSRYCRAIVRDEHEGQDVLQNAMMHALAALQAGERDLKVRPWLFRIVHNESVSQLRRRRSADVPIDELVAAGVGVEDALEQRERLALLVEDLQSLSERQRAAVVMRELSGLSIDEIAAALATSPGAAKQTLFEARSALHELAEGRAMGCEEVRETISAHDGRVLRGRRVRAHLRACAGCRAFRATIETRKAQLWALAPPLPALATAGLWAQLLGGTGGAGRHAGGALGGGGALAGGSAAGSLGFKALTGVVLLTAASAGTVQLTTRGPVAPHRAVPPPAVPRHAATVAPAPGAATAPRDANGRAGARSVAPRRSPSPAGGVAGATAPAAASPTASGQRSPAPASADAGGDRLLPHQRQARGGGASGGGEGAAHRSPHAHAPAPHRDPGSPSRGPGARHGAAPHADPPAAGGGKPAPQQAGDHPHSHPDHPGHGSGPTFVHKPPK